MKTAKKLIALLLTLCMMLSLLPTAVFAEEPDEVTSGTCGETITWTLDSTGLLTLTGTGSTGNYEDSTSPLYPYADKITKVVVGEGITDLGDFLFWFMEKLTSVTLPSTLTRIGSSVFYGTGLTEVELPEGLTSIGQCAFSMSALESIALPSSLTTLSDHVFAHCKDLSEVSLSALGSIPAGTFMRCTALQEITIPKTIHAIGADAFLGCTALEQVTLIPGAQLGEGLMSIGDRAFADCAALPGIELPDSVMSIGEYAFAGCATMQELYIPAGIAQLGKHCFGYTNTDPAVEYEHQYAVIYPACAKIANAAEIPYAFVPFADDTETGTWSWASKSIYNCVAAGVIRGYPDNTFQPDKPVTRAEFVVMLYGIFKNMYPDQTVMGHPFTDAKASWYQLALSWAHTYGIVSGITETTFGPDKPISRQDVAAILYRFIKMIDEGEAPTGNLIDGFSDAASVSGYAKPAMEYCLENGILYGMSPTTLAPKATATRAQAAAFIYRTFLAE